MGRTRRTGAFAPSRPPGAVRLLKGSPNMKSSKDVRTARGLTQMQVAVLADVSLPSLRMYEASRVSVGGPVRSKLDAVYEKMAADAGVETGWAEHV